MDLDQALSALHDAVLVRVEHSWSDARCKLIVRPVGTGTLDAEISLGGVRSLKLSHHQPWGPSSSIAKASFKDKTLTLEMQSGDVIVVAASEAKYGAL